MGWAPSLANLQKVKTKKTGIQTLGNMAANYSERELKGQTLAEKEFKQPKQALAHFLNEERDALSTIVDDEDSEWSNPNMSEDEATVGGDFTEYYDENGTFIRTQGRRGISEWVMKREMAKENAVARRRRGYESIQEFDNQHVKDLKDEEIKDAMKWDEGGRFHLEVDPCGSIRSLGGGLRDVRQNMVMTRCGASIQKGKDATAITVRTFTGK
ncbi:hypothetical protein K402DRAFT_416245 [Aulographum hederae CBS 113979]|uniref:Uncharacterized protein n=1 Tax=Aulographum hederae CBS 113979 TaxID=1176131 RepID=A0A6G1HHU5_9PEZI|nr:hypothetical protein K402DRAFT_416245 [Aulographum hederae CBS 113979]